MGARSAQDVINEVAGSPARDRSRSPVVPGGTLPANIPVDANPQLTILIKSLQEQQAL